METTARRIAADGRIHSVSQLRVQVREVQRQAENLERQVGRLVPAADPGIR